MKNWREIFALDVCDLESFITQAVLEQNNEQDKSAVEITKYENSQEYETIYVVTYYSELILIVSHHITTPSNHNLGEIIQDYRVIWSAKYHDLS